MHFINRTATAGLNTFYASKWIKIIAYEFHPNENSQHSTGRKMHRAFRFERCFRVRSIRLRHWFRLDHFWDLIHCWFRFNSRTRKYFMHLTDWKTNAHTHTHTHIHTHTHTNTHIHTQGWLAASKRLSHSHLRAAVSRKLQLACFAPGIWFRIVKNSQIEWKQFEELLILFLKLNAFWFYGRLVGRCGWVDRSTNRHRANVENAFLQIGSIQFGCD